MNQPSEQLKILERRLSSAVENEDIRTLDAIYNNLGKSGACEEKKLLSKAFMDLFEFWHFEFTCGRIKGKDYGLEMLSWIEKAEELNKSYQYNGYFGQAFRMLCDLDTENKVAYINKTIEAFKGQVESSPYNSQANVDVANAIFDKVQICGVYSDDMMAEVCTYLFKALSIELKKNRRSYYSYTTMVSLHALLDCTYKILTLPFVNQQSLHQQFMHELYQVMSKYVEKDNFLYFVWAKDLERVYCSYRYNSSTNKKFDIGLIEREIKKVLDNIMDYESDDKLRLNALGHLFHDFAKVTSYIEYYETAFNYFNKAILLDAQCWYYPMYATNALEGLAQCYLRRRNKEKAIEAFNTGVAILAEIQKKIQDDYTLSLHYATFLYHYSRDIARHKDKKLLLLTQKVYEQTLIIGNGKYDSPYIGLAKVALKLGNRKGCLDILHKCVDLFSTDLSKYNTQKFFNDPDLKEIAHELMDLN